MFRRSKPVDRIKPAPNAGLERGIRPVCDVGDIAVFDGIEMDVIHVAGEIGIVAYAVLPKTPLPDPALPVTLASVRRRSFTGRLRARSS